MRFFFFCESQDFRERVLQAGLEKPWKDPYFPVCIHEMAHLLPHRTDRQSHRILQQSRRRESRRRQVRFHLQHDVGTEVNHSTSTSTSSLFIFFFPFFQSDCYICSLVYFAGKLA